LSRPLRMPVEFAPPPVATGREMRIRPSRAGGRRLEGGLGWAEIQEARCARCRQSASNGAEAATAERHVAPDYNGVRPAGSDPGGRSCSAGHKSPQRGCRKATRGP